MRGPIAMGLFASIMALIGCDQKPVYEDTRHLENPPPKPPNCLELPELKNITLKDGSIADVRIVQFRETKFYVPANLISDWFTDKEMRPGGQFVSKSDLSRFLPDIHSDECPGLVHVVNPDAPIGAGFGIPLLKELRREGGQLRRDDGVRTGIGFGLISQSPGQKDNPRDFMDNSKVNIRYADDVIIGFTMPGNDVMKTPAWDAYRKDAILFTIWLTTAPKYRDNNKVFTLGAKG